MFKPRFGFGVLNCSMRLFSLRLIPFLHMNFSAQKHKAQEADLPWQTEETHPGRERKFPVAGETGANRKLGVRQGAAEAKGKFCSR